MNTLNPAYLKAITEVVSHSPFFSLLSMEMKPIVLGESRLEVMIEEKHLQPFGMVHGGVYSSLVDAAAFWSVYPLLEEGVGLTTVEMKLNYLAPASKGYLIARGRNIKMGKTLCLGKASIEDENGRLLAYGTETMMIVNNLKIKNNMRLPKKFLG
ncbi:MAG: PaaI family thioesterase [Desulfobacterales bacterium]